MTSPQESSAIPPPAQAAGEPAPLAAPDAPDAVPAVTPPRRPNAGRWLLVGAAATACGCLALIAAGRLAHLDDLFGWPYSVLNAFTPFIYLPAYTAAMVAFAYRRRLLLLSSAMIIAIHLVWITPEIISGDAQSAPPGSVPIRLMTANLNYANSTAARLGTQITTEHPDVVVLQETSELSLASLLSSGALDDYGNREVRKRAGAFGAAVFSRFPLRDVVVVNVAGLPFLQATVDVDAARSFRLVAVHTIPPVDSAYTSRWHTQLDALRTQARSADLPLVLAGDFNATRDHRPFRRLLDAGMRDTHDAAGAGWTPTWNAIGMLPRTLRIDHVLVSEAFATTGYRAGKAFGSDHTPVTVDLALR